MANWSELPSELLQLISNLSSNSSETRRFRSVCSYWRSSVVPSKLSSHFFSPSIKNFTSQPNHDDHFGLRLVKQSIFLFSLLHDPSSSWVIIVEEHKPSVLTLISPFTNKSLTKNVDFISILDLTNVDIFEVGHEYVVRNINGSDHMSLYDNLEHEKVGFVTLGNIDNFTLLSTHKSTGKLLMYQSCIQEWTFLDDFVLGYNDRGDFVYDLSMRYVDVVDYDGGIYAVTDSGRTVIIEYGEDMSVVVNLMVKSIIGGNKKCLVKSADELLLVDLYTFADDGSIEINAIDVYKLDKAEKRWVLLNSLEGRSIFLSNSSSFSAKNLHGVKENCIYFSFNKIARDLSEKKGGNKVENDGGDYCDKNGVESNEVGVFEYDKGCFGSLEENFDGSNLFSWPPPSWLKFLRRDL